MRVWEEGGRANTQTGGRLTFSEKGLGSSEGKLVVGNESSFWRAA